MTRTDMSAVINGLRRMEKMCCQRQREDLPPAAQWLRDNARMLYSEAWSAREACQKKKKRQYEQLYAFCKQYLQQHEGRVEEKTLYHAAQEAQQERPFTVTELCEMPFALRCALLERLYTLLPAVEGECRAYEGASQLAARLARGEREEKCPDDALLLSRSMELCIQSVDAAAAREMESLMREAGRQPAQIRQLAQEARLRTAMQVADVIGSLRNLGKIPFQRLTERLSVACQLLLREGTFRRMDSASRALYLAAVARIARRGRVSEARVCEMALRLAAENTGAAGESGYYLLENPELLLRDWGCKAGLLKKYRLRGYALAMLLGALGFFVWGAFKLPWWGVFPFAMAGAQLAQRIVQRQFLRHAPPRRLPRLHARELRRAGRTLVIVPTVLMDAQHTLRMVRQLSVLYLANKSAPLDFMLLSDFTDADGERTAQDEEILAALRMGIAALNDAYGTRFFALHRERTFDAGEGCFIGSERKRGAILTLCRLLCGERTAERMAYASLPVEALKGRYRYVITLDADTFMPSGAAEKMILTMLHPLQRGRVTVLQPRMATLPMHVKTWAQYLLGGMSGADGYDGAAGDFYQDAFGRGSFMGKGIFEPEAFLAATQSLPAGRILSHDLIEGELAGCRRAGDIVCYDGHPRTAEGFLRRAHRWTRGDWQLLPLLKSKQLDALAKFKMADNLRLSLTPALRVIALIAAARAQAYLPFVLLLWPLKAVGEYLFLSADACTRLDGALRALWRMFIRHKKLLEWTTAAQADKHDLYSLREQLLPMLPGALMVFAAAYSVFVPGFLLGAAWLAYPLWREKLSLPWGQRWDLSPQDRSFLMGVAGDTLRFFRENVTERTHFLPPDNVQLSPPRGAAMRTSPTNIGMYLLSLCAARKLSLIDSDEMLCAMRRTAETLETLEKWHGNLYNWYDLNTLAPMEPRFVSSVDAGNCCICLQTAAQCARRYMHEGDASCRDVPARLDALHRNMRLNRLYDKREELFYIGYDESRGEMTEGHYDLMASEALLLSYVAIASGQVSEKHWWRLGRTYTLSGGGKTLLSWSGTMFEYLLPALLLPSFPGSLLHQAQRACVKTQLLEAQDRPLGVSESGYAQFDEHLNYSYRAFGLAELSLSGQCPSGVRAPYAAALALLTHPKEATAALRAWKARGVYGVQGFFEAEDFVSNDIPHIVCSHMAHHQGMILCAVCNALCGEDLTHLAFSLPRMRAHLPLLCEMPPRRVHKLPQPLREHRDQSETAPLHLRARDGLPPDVHVLSGGGTVMLQSALGQGYVARGEMLLTRFDPRVGEISGPQLYLRAVKSDETIRLTGGEYVFGEGQWRARSVLGAVRATTSGCVDPITGAVIYCVQVRNTLDKAIRTEITLYLEPALEKMQETRVHQAFSGLFVQVHKSGAREMTVTRRLRDTQEERRTRLRVLTAGSGAAQMLNDRTAFLGREAGRLPGLHLPEEEFSLQQTVDPCAAIRLPWILPPGREERMYFALGMGELPENEEQAERAKALCASRAQVLERLEHCDARQTALLCRAAGYFLFEDLPRENKAACSVRDLWTQGVSGDQPFALVELRSLAGEAALTEALRVLSLLFEHGAPGEAVILLPREHRYERPLHTLAEEALLPLRALRGRAHIIDDENEAFARAARALCALHMDCDQDLRSHLMGKDRPLPPAFACAQEPLPVMERLQDFNGYGGFTQEGGYTVLPSAHGGTPAPWSYLLCNDQFGTLVCEQGILYSHAGNARLRRITRWHQDGVRITPSEQYSLLEGGKRYSFTKAGTTGEGYRVTYETGTALYECAAGGLLLTLHCFTDEKERAGLRIATIRNTGSTPREITFRARAELCLGEDGRGTALEARDGKVLARSGEMPGLAVFAMTGAQARVTEENSAELTLELLLHGGETREIAVVLGYCAEEKGVMRLCEMLLNAKERLRRARGAWDERLRRLQFFLPEDTLERAFNTFLPYQVYASRLMMRAGFYQCGGAWGFRDQLQDMLMVVYTDPERVKQHLLLCASRQYLEGDVQHWWHPFGAGVRTRISDDLLFLPYVTARYVYVTGDREILKCHAPYLYSKPLSDAERDRYELAQTTQQTGSLTEHCLRAIAHVQLGERGLPLMQGGDWNDGMDCVGGESVWLGCFYRMVLEAFAPLCEEAQQRALEEKSRQLKQNLRCAFEEKWFIRAWYRDGRSLGAPSSEVGRIDLISQCFAAFAGLPRSQVVSALHHAWELLHDERLGITRLMKPPFSMHEGAGYIGAYLPGVRENGGQYTHAVPWFMRALLMYGQKERAWQLLHEILPCNHAFDEVSARHYRVEPYVLAADIYRWGRGGWTWYTGSAAWLYEVFVHDFLGFDKRGNEVTLRPCTPDDWEECTVLYRYGESRYQLTASRETRYVTLDGAMVQGGYITLRDDGRAHEARFPLDEKFRQNE